MSQNHSLIVISGFIKELNSKANPLLRLGLKTSKKNAPSKF